jgi:glutamyl/glutaminyl-tRNA synthetase
MVAELKSGSGPLLIDEVDALPKKVGAQSGVKGKSLYMPMRAAVTGKVHGPELKLILPILGRESVLKRIEALLIQAR